MKPDNKHGTFAEKNFAKRQGGRLTPASGAIAGMKGDVILDNYLVECTSTVKNSIKLDLAWLLKINKEALMKGKSPALSIQFVTSDGQAIQGGKWVMVRECDFTGND